MRGGRHVENRQHKGRSALPELLPACACLPQLTQHFHCLVLQASWPSFCVCWLPMRKKNKGCKRDHTTLPLWAVGFYWSFPASAFVSVLSWFYFLLEPWPCFLDSVLSFPLDPAQSGLMLLNAHLSLPHPVSDPLHSLPAFVDSLGFSRQNSTPGFSDPGAFPSQCPSEAVHFGQLCFVPGDVTPFLGWVWPGPRAAPAKDDHKGPMNPSGLKILPKWGRFLMLGIWSYDRKTKRKLQ